MYLPQSVRLKLVIGCKEAAIPQQNHAERAQRRAGRDEEHDHDLVAGGLAGILAGNDLPGHHAGQADQSGNHHRIDGRDHADPDSLLDGPAARFPARRAQSQQGFDLIALRLTDPLIVGPLNALRAELGLGPVRDVLRTWAHSPDLCVCLFPEWFAAPQPDWPTCAVTTDFPLDDGGGEPSEELRAFVEAGPPPVVFTAGSAMHHAGRYFEHATQAARLLNRRVVLVAKGFG